MRIPNSMHWLGDDGDGDGDAMRWGLRGWLGWTSERGRRIGDRCGPNNNNDADDAMDGRKEEAVVVVLLSWSGEIWRDGEWVTTRSVEQWWMVQWWVHKTRHFPFNYTPSEVPTTPLKLQWESEMMQQTRFPTRRPRWTVDWLDLARRRLESGQSFENYIISLLLWTCTHSSVHWRFCINSGSPDRNGICAKLDDGMSRWWICFIG